MSDSRTDLWRVLGKAAHLWARPDLLEVQEDFWVAYSGQRNVNYNMACCRSPVLDVLVDRCLQPTLDLKKPAIIMLSGPGLATAQRLVESGWVTVGSLPLMVLAEPIPFGPPAEGARPLTYEELSPARELLSECYGLDDATAVAAIPDAVAGGGISRPGPFMTAGGWSPCVTSALQDGLVVIWSMATRTDGQRRGYGRQLLEAMLTQQFADGAEGSLLHSSVAGEALYRRLGFTVVEYLQLWSRPRWVLSAG